MSTPGASSLWSGSSALSGLDSSWGIGTPFSSGANNMNLLGYGGNSLSNNQGHMQSGASTLGDLNNSNPIMGSRGSWGAPGTMPPSQSTNKPVSSSGNMQGTMPVSGAQPNGPQSSQQGGSFTTSQSPGPNTASSQGNSAFGNVGFQKISTSNASSGLAINPATSIMNSASNGSSAQSSDNLGSAGWGMPVSTQDSRLTGTNSWGNPSGAEWDQSSSSSASQNQPQVPPSSGSIMQNNSPGIPASAQEQQQRPSSWAQAAGKGLNLQANNQNPPSNISQEDVQRQALIRRAIESHDGWGKKPIRQDTEWSVETSPKVQRKISTASVVPEQQKGTNNMWNNNNGTAIWEANKDNMSAWGGNPSAVGRAPGPPPTNWPPQQKPPDPAAGGQWGGPVQAPGPDKGMAPWGAPGTQPNNNTNNNNWGGSTETGSWGGNFGSSTPGASGGIATWGDHADGTSSWGEGRNSGSGGGGNGGSGDGTSYWGDPSVKPPPQQPNWNNAPPGQQAIGQNRKMGSGWGDPIGPPDPKIDDGTGLWASNGPPPPQPGRPQWGGDAGNPQWNPGAIGKPNPKVANQNPAQYGGVDDLNWNLPKDGAIKFPGASSQPPQMRSRLLQQLMDLGFKKDEAQHALISNNMNLQSAIADLYSRRGAKKDELEVARIHSLISDSGASDDISDTQSDSNSFVPNMNPMQNTPYTNAQSKYPFNNPGPSLNQSSLGSSAPSINNALQQKIIQKFQNHQQPPPPSPSMNSINPPQGPMGRGQMPTGQQNPAVQHQMAQQQILHQLRMAVQAGLISPQLLNQQLPAPVLVMLQQLLQQQQNLQQLITTQQMLQQPKMNANPLSQRQQLEQVAVRINQIKQQILLLQRNIAQAQTSLLNKTQTQPPQQPLNTDTSEPPLQQEMNNLSISTSQQPKSRLNQWKCPSPDKESPEANTSTSNETPTSSTTTTNNATSEAGEASKTVGSKPIQQSSSTPNLRRYDELGLGGDSTWAPNSSAASQNWPNTSSPSTSSNLSDISEHKESLSATAGNSAGNSSVLDSIPAIPEFVPGKPWQGITKNVEDDPHITPGSFSRSLSVNTIKDDYLSTFTKSSPTSESNSLWPQKPLSSTSTQNKHWSAGESNLTPTSFGASDVWSMSTKGGAMSRPPPGIPQNKGWQGNSSGSNWSGSSAGVSTALLLKNLTPQIDGSTLRTLCMQHGPLQYFYLNLTHFQALVKYCTTEEAVKAQKALNTCLLSNTTIVAEFVSEVEALRFVEQQNAMPSAPSQWSSMGQQQQQQRQQPPAMGNSRQQDMSSMSNWGVTPPTSTGTGMWGSSGSGGSLWGDNLEDNSAHNLLGNMLGDTM